MAIPTWNGRVSPVLDVATCLLVVDAEGGAEVARREVEIAEAHLTTRVNRIRELGVEVLICAAVSGPLEAALYSAGVRVLPQTCGPVEEVLRAFLAGRLTDEAFLMPGCCGRRRRCRGGSNAAGGAAGAGRRGRGRGAYRRSS